jgi:hypothetical protein
MSELRVLPDQLSGLAQCCNRFFFVGSGIECDSYNFFQAIAIFAHQVISLFGVPPAASWCLSLSMPFSHDRIFRS